MSVIEDRKWWCDLDILWCNLFSLTRWRDYDVTDKLTLIIQIIYTVYIFVFPMFFLSFFHYNFRDSNIVGLFAVAETHRRLSVSHKGRKNQTGNRIRFQGTPQVRGRYSRVLVTPGRKSPSQGACDDFHAEFKCVYAGTYERIAAAKPPEVGV